MADLIPVIRASMGGREYYIGKMTFQELAAKVQFYEDLNTSAKLDELLQRRLLVRAADMTQYLLKQKERFYGAIIIAAWGGKPAYIRVRMEDHPLLDNDFEYGLLKFDGRQEYFALDGQHRLKSIKEAIEKDSKLRSEEVSVVILTHERTAEGNVKTRRLFHTLNRYAKPTTTGENIALDEDNIVSIVTRMLLTTINLLHADNLELIRKNLTKTQTDKFTSLAALYDFNYAVLDQIYRFDKEYLRFRPEATHVDNAYKIISSLWLALLDNHKELKDYESGRRTAGDIREPENKPAWGHLLFRPIGLRIYGSVVAHALAEIDYAFERGAEIDPRLWDKVLERIALLPVYFAEYPWKSTIFRSDKIQTGGRAIALKVALYMLSLGVDKQDEEKLREEYRTYMDDHKARLPQRLL